jgi:hypothetical protein
MKHRYTVPTVEVEVECDEGVPGKRAERETN